MKVLRQFDPLVVEEITESKYTCAHHTHTYYEMVYIHKGWGTQLFNGNRLDYRLGDLFLLAPGDDHEFFIEETTTFTFIKFTEAYFQHKQHLCPDAFYAANPETLMHLREIKEVRIEFDEPSAGILKACVEGINNINELKDITHSPVVFHLIMSIFGLVKEMLQHKNIHLHRSDVNHEQLISYIHQYIYDRDLISVKAIADHFHISPTYFSNYFKRSFGIAYQQYLDDYRIKLVEKRLELGGLKLKQIAREFGFTDASHLAKAFRRQHGISPSAYKKQHEGARKRA